MNWDKVSKEEHIQAVLDDSLVNLISHLVLVTS